MRTFSSYGPVNTKLHYYAPCTELAERAYKEGKLPQDFSWTSEHDPRVIVLPPAQGHAPLYVDQLSWRQLSELMFRFAGVKKKYSLLRKIPSVLKNLSSFADFHRYTILFLVFLKFKMKNMLKN